MYVNVFGRKSFYFGKCVKLKSKHTLYVLANAAFIATVAAADGLSADDNKKYAMSQINYLLGDNKLHISYEIGFGSNFPKRPHHRGRLVTVQYNEQVTGGI